MRFLPVFLLAAAVSAAPDAAKQWKAGQKQLHKKEKAYWDGIQKRVWAALETLGREREMVEAGANVDATPNPVNNFSDLDNLYRDFADIQAAMGAQDIKLAESGHPKALITLFKELLNVAAAIDKAEADLAKAKPSRRMIIDQRHGIRRHGLERREIALIKALAKCENAADYLAAQGFKQATKKDGRNSFVRRVAVVDALGLTRSETALNALAGYAQNSAPQVRIAALEALLPFGAKARPALVSLLDDSSHDVRRALLQGVALFASEEPGWIAPILRHLERAKGQLRTDHIVALEALTNQRFGDDAKAWREWHDDYSKEIAGGSFKKSEIEVREVERKTPTASCSFYGVSTASRRVAFAIDASRRMWWPADWDIQKTGYKYNWDRRRNKWEDQHESHQKVLQREFGKTTQGMDPVISFGILTFAGDFRVRALGEKRLLSPGKRDFRKAAKLIEDIQADGWCSPHKGLKAAMGLGGDAVDTVFLLTAGEPSGGRFMGVEPALAAFRRAYRFRRVVVHALRIVNAGDVAEAYMKGVAKLTGGTYVWLKKPPAGS